MATLQHWNIHGDDDYINMEGSLSSNFFCYSIDSTSPSQSREFEFQKSSFCNARESTTSPADELFYKGKLLPLQLPPRLQMVRKLLENTKEPFEESYGLPFIATDISTPMESCNVSPSESCRISFELEPDECYFEWSTEVNGFIRNHQNKSWSKKLKQIKQLFKASRAYLKSWFSKSGCSDPSCAKAACNVETDCVSKGKYHPFVQIYNEKYHNLTSVKKIIEKVMVEDSVSSQRRSFPGAIQQHSTNKCSSSSTSSSASSSSSSFSCSSNGIYDLQLLKRSSSANSEIENSIEGAIAYCKQSADSK